MATGELTKVLPISFADPMVRAVLEGRKTQTRRIILVDRLSPNGCPIREVVPSLLVNDGRLWDVRYDGDNPKAIRCPYGRPGDWLWVKESVAIRQDVDPTRDLRKALHYIHYRATYQGDLGLEWHNYHVGWRSPGDMPRWASRIRLEVTGIRAERLHDISEEDKIAEGSTPNWPFGTTWKRVYTKKGERFEDNPWVWAIDFRRRGQGGGASDNSRVPISSQVVPG